MGPEALENSMGAGATVEPNYVIEVFRLYHLPNLDVQPSQ